MTKPILVGLFANRNELIARVGFIDFYHRIANDPDHHYYDGVLTECEGKKYLDVYIGQGDSVFINIDDPTDVRFPRNASKFHRLDSEKDQNDQRCGVIKYPPGQNWTHFAKYE